MFYDISRKVVLTDLKQRKSSVLLRDIDSWKTHSFIDKYLGIFLVGLVH